jgi:hypothetical protein
MPSFLSHYHDVLLFDELFLFFPLSFPFFVMWLGKSRPVNGFPAVCSVTNGLVEGSVALIWLSLEKWVTHAEQNAKPKTI